MYGLLHSSSTPLQKSEKEASRVQSKSQKRRRKLKAFLLLTIWRTVRSLAKWDWHDWSADRCRNNLSKCKLYLDYKHYNDKELTPVCAVWVDAQVMHETKNIYIYRYIKKRGSLCLNATEMCCHFLTQCGRKEAFACWKAACKFWVCVREFRSEGWQTLSLTVSLWIL